MIRFTRDAEAQANGLIDYYVVLKQRPEAADALLAALNQALQRIGADNSTGLPAPRPYPELASLGYLWLKVGAYWIAWTMQGRHPVVTNVLHAAANLPGRVSTRLDVDKDASS